MIEIIFQKTFAREEAMPEILQVTTTCENKSDAEHIAQQLLHEGLIACGQVDGPIFSHYRWQGENVRGQEYVLRVKTIPSLLARIISRIEDLHPYEVPEIIGHTITIVNEAYARWVHDEVTQ